MTPARHRPRLHVVVWDDPEPHGPEPVGDVANRIINRMQAACARSWMGPRLRLVQDTAEPKHVS